jgi:hypothetical protein
MFGILKKEICATGLRCRLKQGVLRAEGMDAHRS